MSSAPTAAAAAVLYLLIGVVASGKVSPLQSGQATATGTIVDAHPCRFLPSTSCFAQNFEFVNKPTPFLSTDLGSVENDDESHPKHEMWKIRSGNLILEGANTGGLGQCQSSGSMALLRPVSPFFTGDVTVSYDVLLESPAIATDEVGHGFVFRYQSSGDFYRFEWQRECMSIVHYVGVKKKRIGTIVANRTDAPITFDRWYHVYIDMKWDRVNLIVKAIRARGDNKVPELKDWHEESYSLTVKSDDSYNPVFSFVGGLYGLWAASLRVDNVVIVASEFADRLGSWDDVPYPDGAICPSLDESICFYETFDRTKYLDDFPHAIYADGALDVDKEVRWSLPRYIGADEDVRANHVLAETSAYSALTTSVKEPCQQLYGTYFMINDTSKVAGDELIVSFLMKATDARVRGIGIILRLQEAIPGFRPTPSYYRYSWGSAPSGDNCDGLLFHNGNRGRFESVMSEPTEEAAPDALSINSWHRVEVHLSRRRIEVTRDGVLVGQPIVAPLDAPSLKLAWGGLALYCGGHEGATADGEDVVCAFDDLLVVNALMAHEGLVWDGKSTPPAERPPNPRELVAVGNLAGTRWEGMRNWTMYYTEDRQGVCLANGETIQQPVSIEFRMDGSFAVYAHEVKLDAGADGKPRFMFAENRIARIVEPYDEQQQFPKVRYRHPDGTLMKHCVTFKMSGDRQTAFMSWSKENECANEGLPMCGFTAQMSILGDVSALYPPRLVVTDPLPGRVEQWTVGQKQVVSLRIYDLYTQKAKVFVQLISKVGSQEMVKLNRVVEFEHEETDQWTTGTVKMTTTLTVDEKFLLGPSTVRFMVMRTSGSVSAGVEVLIECPVCQTGPVGSPASACAYWCGEANGCSEPKCEIGGVIRCSERFTGWNEGLCTKWTKDRPAVCKPHSGCTKLDEYEYCNWSSNKKKPISQLRCESPECNKNCDLNTKAPAWAMSVTNDASLICETNTTTAKCAMPVRCWEGGVCRLNKPEPTPKPPVTRPPANAVPSPSPVPAPPVRLEQPVTPICRQCVNDFGEPGSQLWCVCCKHDCNAALDKCKSFGGFCTSRCLDSEGTFCPMATRAAIEVPFPDVGTRPPTPDFPPQQPSPTPAPTESDDEEIDEARLATTTMPTPTTTPDVLDEASATPSPNEDEEQLTHQVLNADSSSADMMLIMPWTTLVMGAALSVAIVAFVRWWRMRTVQKPVDLTGQGHVA